MNGDTDIDELVAGIRSEDTVEQVACALLLAETEATDRAALEALVGALGETTSREVAWACAYCLGRFGLRARPAVNALLRALDHEDASVREAAGQAIDCILSAPGAQVAS